MSYQVLARKWRPRTFDQLVGQDHVRRALANGLGQGRIHHAYLFTGTRGVGKTTIARILAKCLNCEAAGVTATPCGECGACREIDEGRFVDLIEVDAASRTQVEDTRELLDNVQYAPTRGRYKIYLVDEVHMLSRHSFNALLKTLEEPPGHVKFLLATTDPHKLPATVLSRCLQFNLKHLPVSLIAQHLTAILEREGIAAEPGAVERIARAAEGSVRDGLSLMDQALAFTGGGTVEEAAVRDMLGTIGQDFVFGVLEAAAAGDGGAVLATVARMGERACDFGDALAEVLAVLHRVAVAQTVPDGLDEDTPDRERLLALAEALSPEECQLYYQIALGGRRDMPLAPDPRTGFEMTALRMLAFRPASVDAAEAPAGETGGVAAQPAAAPAGAGERSSAPETAGTPAPPRDTAAGGAATGTAAPAPRSNAATASPEPEPEPEPLDGDWFGIVAALRLGGMAKALAEHCFVIEHGKEHLRLGIDPGHGHLVNPSMQARLQEALAQRYGDALRVTIDVEANGQGGETPAALNARASAERQAEAERAIESDPHVAALKEAFDAQVPRESVRPRGDD